ncbi:hypothetical protein [Candidatus Spongiihabitans sp.]|uniref:hypothetical protein n=1 Tax=Candidatus Spongiihabitans sp. TaxID=3101308 RepID=UPI003C7AE7EC
MIEELEIYGFGSYFLCQPEYHDVDLLIVHRSDDPKSCLFAIQCKQYFISNVAGGDVTILSQHEEQQISFIAKSGARCLGKVDESCREGGLREILRRVSEARTHGFVDQCYQIKT